MGYANALPLLVVVPVSAPSSSTREKEKEQSEGRLSELPASRKGATSGGTGPGGRRSCDAEGHHARGRGQTERDADFDNERYATLNITVRGERWRDCDAETESPRGTLFTMRDTTYKIATIGRLATLKSPCVEHRRNAKQSFRLGTNRT